MIKSKRFLTDLYESIFVFVLSDNYEEVDDKYGIEFNEIGGCCVISGRIYIIFNPNVHLKVLVHECDHAVSVLWDMLGIKKMSGVDECYAYMIAWVFDNCYQYYLKHKEDERKNQNRSAGPG